MADPRVTLRIELDVEQVQYLLARIEGDVIAQGEQSVAWRTERSLDEALLDHEQGAT